LGDERLARCGDWQGYGATSRWQDLAAIGQLTPGVSAEFSVALKRKAMKGHKRQWLAFRNTRGDERNGILNLRTL
jgi:hypothetical protein